MSNVTLHARRLTFLSPLDEAAFFSWLDSMKDFATARGDGDTIVVEVTSSKISDDQLRELIALFHRYRIDLQQLSVFENRANKGWLRRKSAYWYEAMFDCAKAA